MSIQCYVAEIKRAKGKPVPVPEAYRAGLLRLGFVLTQRWSANGTVKWWAREKVKASSYAPGGG